MGWGPGKSRFTDPKRHFQKPLELSPLVAIDRERCILCYRCVRFSQEVAEDEQLQLLERGDKTLRRHLRRAALHRPLPRQHHRALPRRGADLLHLPLPRPALGHRGRGLGLHALPEPVQRQASRSATSGSCGCSPATTPRSTTAGSATRAASPSRCSTRRSGSPGRWSAPATAASARSPGTRRSTRSPTAIRAGGRERGRDRRRRHLERGGLARPADPPRPAAPRTSTARPARWSRPARRALAARPRRPDGGPRPRRRDPGGRRRSAARDADPRPADPQGGAAQPRQADGRLRASDRTRRRAPRRRSATRPGDAASFLGALAGALGAEGYDAGRALRERGRARSRRTCATLPTRRSSGASGSGAAPARSRRSTPAPARSRCTSGSAPGLLEVPEESNGRGLREVGCLPGAKPGLEPDRRRGAAAPRSRRAWRSARARRHAARQRGPGPHPPRLRGLAQGAGGVASSSRSPAFEDESTRLADMVIPAETHAEKEGTVTHPDGRLQRLRRNVPLPEGMIARLALPRRGRRRARRRPRRRGARRRLRRALERGPFYDTDSPTRRSAARGCAGATGTRAVLDAAARRRGGRRLRADAGSPHGSSVGPRSPADGPSANGLLLGTYRDLWAADVTKRNPALRFLMPKQKLELAAKDAESLELAQRRRGDGLGQRPQRRGAPSRSASGCARAPLS